MVIARLEQMIEWGNEVPTLLKRQTTPRQLLMPDRTRTLGTASGGAAEGGAAAGSAAAAVAATTSPTQSLDSKLLSVALPNGDATTE